MSVHKDKKRNTWYFMVRVDGKQTLRRNKDWTLKRHAIEAEREFLNELDSKDITKLNATYNEVVKAYLEYSKINRKQSSAHTMKYILNNHSIEFFNDMILKNITTKDIEDYQLHLLNKTYTVGKGKKPIEKKYTNSTISKIQIQVRLVFQYAVRHRIITYNPFDQVETVQRQELEDKKEITILSHEEFDKFINVIPNKETQDITARVFFSILYWCGLRFGEALALNIADVNTKKKTLSITKNYDNKNKVVTTTKTGNVRIVDIPDKCLIEIRALFKKYEQLSVRNDFPLLGLRKRLSKSTMERKKELYISEAKIPYFTFHELRHTHVSTLIQLGMRDIDIAKRLGHSVEMVNNTYGHLFPSDKENMMDKLNNM